jgi:hypothetical protein
MKMVLYFCVLILGQSAFAGSSGGFDVDDDAPAARPSASRPAAPKTAPAKSYRQCSQSTNRWESNAEIAKEMFEKVLKYDDNFPIRLAEDRPCTGRGCAKVFLNKDRSGVLLITLAASMTASSASKVCQSGSHLRVTVDTMFGEKILEISRKNSRQVNVEIVGSPEYNNSYTIQ